MASAKAYKSDDSCVGPVAPNAPHPCITQMGMGVDVHGRAAAKAAKRAVSDAIRFSQAAQLSSICRSLSLVSATSVKSSSSCRMM